MSNKKPIHIFGHMNPDTDSVCSAIGYGYLKKIIDTENEYIPAVLGAINDETSYVLDYFKIEKPTLLEHLKPQVEDIDFREVVSVHEMDSIKNCLDAIAIQEGRSLPVVDDNDRLMGIVSFFDLLPVLRMEIDIEKLNQRNIPLKNILDTLDIPLEELLKVEKNTKAIRGNIYLYSDLENDKKLREEDLILLSNKEFKSINLRNTNAGFIVVANSEQNELKSIDNKCIFYTSKNVFETIQEIIQAYPIDTIVARDNLEYFTTYETIDDVKKNMITSRFRRFPVVDEQGYIKGMISRSNLFEVEQKKAILMDHNEKGQSIQGIEDVTIVEVIDHHRVADIQTMSPLYFRVEPVGSTCTLVCKMFYENNVEMPDSIAGILLSGILSDTLVFKSPTCTQTDKEIAERLAKKLGLNIVNYGMKMLTMGESLKDKTPVQIVATDKKKFTFGKYKVMISQINTGDFEGLYQLYPEINEEMQKNCETEGFDLAVLLVTNIVIGGTEVIAVGEARWIAENAFSMEKSDASIFLNNTFSRKKEIVPKLMKAAQQ